MCFNYSLMRNSFAIQQQSYKNIPFIEAPFFSILKSFSMKKTEKIRVITNAK